MHESLSEPVQKCRPTRAHAAIIHMVRIYTRGIWKVLSMVLYLSNQFTNPIMCFFKELHVIQLNVDADKGSRLLEDGFWPEEVDCRPWYPRSVLRKRTQRRSNWVETGTYDYAHEYSTDDSNSLRNFTRNID